jgi:hypothetical protein
MKDGAPAASEKAVERRMAGNAEAGMGARRAVWAAYHRAAVGGAWALLGRRLVAWRSVSVCAFQPRGAGL